MEIRSPKDGFIDELFVTHGAVVSKGDAVARLSDQEERHQLARLESMQRILEINKARFDLEQIALRRRAAEIGRGLCELNLALKQDVAAIKSKQAALGLVSNIYHKAADSDAKEAGLLRTRAHDQLLAFEFALSRALAIDEEVRGRIAPEMAFIQSQIERLTLRTTIAGTCVLMTAPGCFVRLGDVIAEIKA